MEHLEKKEISRGIKQIEEKAETNQQKKILNFKTKKDTEKNTKNSKSGEKTKNSKK